MKFRWPSSRASRIEAKLDALIAATAANNAIEVANQEKIMSDITNLDAGLATVQADVTAEDSIIDGAVTLIQGIGGQISAAVAAALAAGATPTQLAALNALKADVEAKTAVLAAAVVAGTPGAPTPAVAVQQATAAAAGS